MDKPVRELWRPGTAFRPPETPLVPMEFLSRSWSDAALHVSKAVDSQHHPPLTQQMRLSETQNGDDIILEVDDVVGGDWEERNGGVSGNTFSFASSKTSLLVIDRIMSQSPEVSSPRTSGRLSHSCSSFSDSPSVSPSNIDDFKQFCRVNHPRNGQFRTPSTATASATGGSKTIGRWLKDRREKKKEEARAHNAQLHAAISVAGVAATVAAIAAATAAQSSSSGKDEQMAKTDMAVASAATLVAAQCVEAAEALGADRDHLASVISSAVNVRSAGDIMTLTAAAATALRGAATLKARGLKEVWNIAAVIPLDKGMVGGGDGGGGGYNGGLYRGFSGDVGPEDNCLGICSRELLAGGCELLKRTRNGDLHWKIVSAHINNVNQVMLKMKSRHVAGTITKKKEYEVVEVVKDILAWPGRDLLEGGENRRYFGLKTIERGVIELECRNQREYDLWTQGVSRLLTIASERSSNSRHRN